MFESLSNKLSEIVRKISGNAKLSKENIQEALTEVKTALLEADVSLKVVNSLLEKITQKALGQEVLKNVNPGNLFIKIVYDEIVNILGLGDNGLNFKAQPPVGILLVGLQGSGKTTTAAKLANWLQQQHKKKVLLVSLDVYRPAAREQLSILAEQINGHYFSTNNNSPCEIAKLAYKEARQNFYDCIIFDTAGRLQIDEHMMEELRQVCEEIKPIEKLLVVDSMIGQEAGSVFTVFNDWVEITGFILTKVDGDARGGAALSVKFLTDRAIKFMGSGEKIDAFEPFYPDRIASRILGMGDVLTLVEEAYAKVDHAKVEKLANKLRKGQSFDFEDFLDQLKQMRKMGGMGKILEKLPNVGNMDKINQLVNDSFFHKMEAIINSMTFKERRYPAFIRGSQKQRIAKGSGTQVSDVNQLLKHFEQMQRMMQKMNSSKLMKIMNFFKG